MSKITLRSEDSEGNIIEHTSLHVGASDIVRNLYHFMLAVTFHKDSIVDALKEVADEYEEKEKWPSLSHE